MATTARPRGRPPKSDDAATPDRLLDAAAAACVASGFENVTLAEIAQRADVTAAAIYNHFGGKDDLLYAAGRRALDGLQTLVPIDSNGSAADHLAALDGRPMARDIALAFLRPESATIRRLLLELHLAAPHHPELARHLEEWHREWATVFGALAPHDDEPEATVKTFFLVLLGLFQIDNVAALGGHDDAIAARVTRIVDSLFLSND